ncbi:MAG: NO-inducible flavohemoprotein [Psittacicella sp.]
MLGNKTIEIIKSTAPLIAKLDPEVMAGNFYNRMFVENPELKDIFNMRHQITGDQRKALFNSVVAYALNIDNLGALGGTVEKIAQKHTSFRITKEQYAIVGESLLKTIKELLNPGDEVLEAWKKAYFFLADIFINREEDIYKFNENKKGGWRGLKEFKVIEIKEESDFVKSFILSPVDGSVVPGYQDGQYIGVWVNSDDFDNQEIRQYSLSKSSAADQKFYRISVKKEQYGLVSNHMHKLNVGATLMLTPPAGDFVLAENALEKPITFISAGIGITPLLSMFEGILSKHEKSVTWMYCAKNSKEHSFKEEVSGLISKYPNKVKSFVWYEEPTSLDKKDVDYNFEGLIDLKALKETIFENKDNQFYICGPLGFIRFVEAQLLEIGVDKSSLHYELFGPDQII